jgi:hypothetical protein
MTTIRHTTAANSGWIAAHRYALPIVRELAPNAASQARTAAPPDAERRRLPAAPTPSLTEEQR